MKLIGKINYYKEQFVFLFDIKDAFYAILLHFFCVFRYNFCVRTGQGISSYPIQQISSVEMTGFFWDGQKGSVIMIPGVLPMCVPIYWALLQYT
jgi:hypothetical protein